MRKFVFLAILPLVACSSFRNVSGTLSINKNGKIAVLPFINNSETPMSGFKAKNLVENELYSKNLFVSPFQFQSAGESFSEKEAREALSSLKEKGIDYAFYGYVNEWRYKAGVDAEPAVSLTVNLYDLKTERVIWSASGSRAMSSYKSAGLAAQKLVKELLKSVK